MPSYFGTEMSDEEFAWQEVADREALRYVRAQTAAEADAIQAAAWRAGVPVEMWAETVGRARRYNG